MKTNTLYNALLFNKEIGPRPYKYRLYFAVQIGDEQPQIHRLYVPYAKRFHEMKLGGTYDIDYSGIRITSATHISTEIISDALYYRLIDFRDLQFMDDRDAKRFGIFDDHYDPSALYYSFKTYRSLVEYKPPLGMKIGVYLLKMLGYILSMFIPIALYILAIYSVSLLSNSTNTSVFRAVSMPIAAILALPIILWMINALHTFFDTCLLSVVSIREYMLSGYALRWGGFKKNITLSRDQRKYYAKFGIISLILLIIGIVIMFIAL